MCSCQFHRKLVKGNDQINKKSILVITADQRQWATGVILSRTPYHVPNFVQTNPFSEKIYMKTPKRSSAYQQEAKKYRFFDRIQKQNHHTSFTLIAYDFISFISTTITGWAWAVAQTCCKSQCAKYSKSGNFNNLIKWTHLVQKISPSNFNVWNRWQQKKRKYLPK